MQIATKIHPTPVVSISPRVLSAMEAFTTFVPHAEKGMLFLGKVDGMNVTLEDFILYPQRGNAYGIDFDTKHKHAAKFWPSVHEYIKQTGLILVGWGHYWHGGVHHSHEDMWQDEKFSINTKDSSPVFVSLTWNHEQIGAEAKLWGKIGGKDLQLSVPSIDVQILVPESAVDLFIMENPPHGKATVRFGEVEIPVEQSEDACDLAIAWLYENPNSLGVLLKQGEIRDYVVDQNVVDETLDKLKGVFSQRYGGFEAPDFGEDRGKSLLGKALDRVTGTKIVEREPPRKQEKPQRTTIPVDLSPAPDMVEKKVLEYVQEHALPVNEVEITANVAPYLDVEPVVVRQAIMRLVKRGVIAHGLDWKLSTNPAKHNEKPTFETKPQPGRNQEQDKKDLKSVLGLRKD